MNHWDPEKSSDWDCTKPSAATVIRLKKDITEIYKDPPPGVVILPDSSDIAKMLAIITGPFETPYEGGFFVFSIRCPPDYPIKPPRIRLLTTGNGTVRFNPNFYKSGKVCLSILGTWTGPAWSPAQSLSTVLMSVQSLMGEAPYHNEPGFGKERYPGDSVRYNNCIRHETIRVAVCDMVEDESTFPDNVKKVVRASFLKYYDYYVLTCKDHIKLDGKSMDDPFRENMGMFRFGALLTRLESLKIKLSAESTEKNEPMEVD